MPIVILQMAGVGDDGEEVAFLQKYYHHLVKCIQPSSFYSWLRSKKVLTEDEQEEIESKYQIRSLRAGQLICLSSLINVE